jgi:hypothetical protein
MLQTFEATHSILRQSPLRERAMVRWKDAMRLELHWSKVESVSAGTTTHLAEKNLAVNSDALRILLETVRGS